MRPGMRFQDRSLQQKLLLLGIGIPFLLVVVLFGLYYQNSRAETISAYEAKAKAIGYTTESVREEMDRKWASGVFTQEQLRRYADRARDPAVSEEERAEAYRNLLRMIPVVTAWEAAMAKAEEGDYRFKVPKFNPRNPDNEPDAVEAKVLKKMERENLDEYTHIAEGEVRYFRSIKLTPSCMMCHGDPATAQELWGTDGTDPTGVRMEGWEVGERHGAFEVIQSLKPAEAEIRASMIRAGLVALIGLGLLAIVFRFAARGISKPIGESVGVVELLAEGDLTRTIETDRKDESGRLAKAVNAMAKGLRGLVVQIGDNASALAMASNQLSSTSNEMASSSEQTSAQTETVAAAGVDLSARMKNMSASAREMENSVQAVASQIREMSASVAEVASSCARENEIAGQASHDALAALELIEQLGGSAQEIGKVVQMINAIADQTNLLALNATIEASRAGEAGKGFAVVAHEVKALAAETAESTGRIVEQVQDIQSKSGASVSSVREVVKVIEEVSTIAGSIAAAVEEQSATSREMAGLIDSVAQATSEFTRQMDESASGAEEVSGNIREVSKAARLVADGAAQTHSSSDELAQMADRLRHLVERFRV